MDVTTSIRELIAETKIHEAQKLAEGYLSRNDSSQRRDLVLLYLEILELQDKQLPLPLLMEGAEFASDDRWLKKLLSLNPPKYKNRILLLQIKMAEQRGRLDELHQLISRYQYDLFESRLPIKSSFIQGLIHSYFKNDFQLKLQELSIILLLGDLTEAEGLIKELIFSCVERSSPRGLKEKLTKLSEIIQVAADKKFLVLYESYCALASEGIRSKQDHKRLVELVIFFEDFKLQVLLLNLFVLNGLDEIAKLYAQEVKANKQYDFVYLEKFFPDLKRFFVKAIKAAETAAAVELPQIDLKLENARFRPDDEVAVFEEDEQEDLLISSLKFQDFTVGDLLELAISFLQSMYPKAAHFAAHKALTSTQDPQTIVKASYLNASALYIMGDYRGVLDTAFSATEHSRTKDDILAFLYLQADVQLRLKNHKQARLLLQRISSIDSAYRMTRERLQRLDET